ncbi:MAG: flagellar motor switch protein FliG [Deltaproteobacteria bacterium]|nr:flagellar motor switch protein FliG [Deltaproteobacteria bacterium]
MANTETHKLSGPQRAALFLLSLGEEQAVEVLKRMSSREIRDLAKSVESLRVVEPSVIKKVQGEFLDFVGTSGLALLARSTFLKMADKALGEKASDVLGCLDEASPSDRECNGFEVVSEIDDKTLATLIRTEQPQTIALILAHTTPEKAARILAELEEDTQVEVVRRMALLEPISMEVVGEVADTLIQQITALGNGARPMEVGGLKVTADVVNQMPKIEEKVILDRLEEDEPDLAEQIRQLKFTFDDLTSVDDRGIQTLLREVDTDTLLLALKTASDEMKEKIFKNMSKRAAEMLKEDLEAGNGAHQACGCARGPARHIEGCQGP